MSFPSRVATPVAIVLSLLAGLGPAIASPAEPASADGAPAPDGSPSKGCFRGSPWPHCRTFWLIESGAYVVATNGGGHPSNEPVAFLGEIGKMVNRSTRAAVGGSVFGGYDTWSEAVRYGAKLRYRRWAAGRNSWDFGAGVTLTPPEHAAVLNVFKSTPGFIGSAGYNLADAVSFNTQALLIPHDGGTEIHNYLGVSFCSGGGIAAAIVGLIALGLYGFHEAMEW